MDRHWLKPLLWQLWRTGGLGKNEAAMVRFLRSNRLDYSNLEALCTQGYITTSIRPPDVSYVPTERGLDLIMGDESELWRPRLEKLEYKNSESSTIQTALKLRALGISYEVINEVTGTNSFNLIEEYEFTVKQNARVNKEIQDFLSGATDFRNLSILVLFNGSPALVSALHRAHIYHLVKLLSCRSSDLSKLRNIGAVHLQRIKQRLDAFGEYLEP